MAIHNLFVKGTYTIMLLVMTCIFTGATSQALAQETAETECITLPQQPLQNTLAAIGKEYGMTIVAPSDLVQGKMAPAISSRTADQALEEALRDSTLEARRSTDGSIVIRKKKTDTPRPAAKDRNQSMADEQDNSAMRLAPVVVTGERTKRTVFETASSVDVVSGKDIENTPSIQEVDDLLKNIPNVDLGGNSNEGPTIRGVRGSGPLGGVYAFFGGSRPRSTITVDGRAISYNEFIFGATSVWDVKRVEVFRGPQTTTQGVNSIAGAIHVVTADPTFEPEYKFQTELGDYKSARFSALASGPLVDDELAVRLAVDLQRRDSFIDLQPTEDYGPDPNTFLNLVARGKILWQPHAIPDLKMKLTLNTSRGTAPQAEYVTTDNIREKTPITVNLPSWSIEAHSATHQMTYLFSDNIDLTNTFTYAHINSERHVDIPSNASATTDKDDLSNETLLHWRAPENGFSGLVGVYLQRNDSDEFLNWVRPGKTYFDDLQTSVGLFTEVTYDLTDRLDLTLGLRYQSDRQERRGTSSGGVSYTVDLDYDKTFDALLPKVVLGYDVGKDFRVGAMVSRGFNPGGVTLIFSDGVTNFFDEETVWNYELFARSVLLDGQMSLNANLFYADYSDYQMNYIYATVPFTVYGIANADEAVSYGLEVSVDYLVNEQLRLFSGLGLLRTEITEYNDAGGLDVEGASFLRSPEITFSLGSEYSPIEALTLGATVRYVGEYKSEDTNDSISAGDYTVVDCKASYDLNEHFTVYGYVNNLFDSFYTVSELQAERAIVGDPRDFGIGLQAKF